jgi:hypothetical protein
MGPVKYAALVLLLEKGFPLTNPKTQFTPLGKSVLLGPVSMTNVIEGLNRVWVCVKLLVVQPATEFAAVVVA